MDCACCGDKIVGDGTETMDGYYCSNCAGQIIDGICTCSATPFDVCEE